MDNIIQKLLPFEWTQFEFMRNALLGILIICPLFSILSTAIVLNRLAFFSDALGHSALAGIGIGVILGLGGTTPVMLIFAAAFALLLNIIKQKSEASADTVIGVCSSFGIALGIILLSYKGNFSHYQNLLIGDILSIKTSELWLLLAMLFIVLMFWLFGFNKLNAVSINASLARSKGIPVILLDNLFVVIVAVIVMVSIRWVGMLIINAMLILPAASARFISSNMRQYHLYALIFSVFSGLCGLITSYYVNTAPGATMVIISCVIFFACALFGKRIRT
ncbi:MAG: metal ABC transporter permease [Oscillospiraceae bacterium]|jgi:zinc transport system permease protein|nr:metal ABC transporter permease [Oscillospiraceae bacterium]